MFNFLLFLHRLLLLLFLLLCFKDSRKICWMICHRISLITLLMPYFPFDIRSLELTKLLIVLIWKEVDSLMCKVDGLLLNDWIHCDVKTFEGLIIQICSQLLLEIWQNLFILIKDHSTWDHREVHHEEFIETCWVLLSDRLTRLKVTILHELQIYFFRWWRR